MPPVLFPLAGNPVLQRDGVLLHSPKEEGGSSVYTGSRICVASGARPVDPQTGVGAAE